jgi:hypothetical protein
MKRPCLGKALLAFPTMNGDDFILRNQETGNQFVVSTRENTIAGAMPIVAASESRPIVMTGTGRSESAWILSTGDPLRVTLEVANVSSDYESVALDVEYGVAENAILGDREALISFSTRATAREGFGACPPCNYSRTVEFTPEARSVFHFRVSADEDWKLTVEVNGI